MKLAEALTIIQSARLETSGDTPRLPIALACGFAPSHLETFLRAHLCKLIPGCSPQIRTGLYGDLIGNIKRLAAEVSHSVVVAEWSDLDPRLGLRRLGGWDPAQLPDILGEVNRSCDLLHAAIEEAARHTAVVACLPSLPLPPVSLAKPARASVFALELRSRVARLSAELSRIRGVRIANPQRLDAFSIGTRLDVKSDLMTGFPYTLAHASALAQVLAEVIADGLAGLVPNRQPKKGLITDLDDTLWRGILGEVGVQAIAWDLENHAQIHGLYQQVLRSLAASGTLIAVASRNDRALVEEAFAARQPILRAADIFPFEVHWGAKSESVTRILAAWNIAADDVVCVDDSAMDLAEIKASHPGAECLLFPRENPQAAYELLERLRDLFGKKNDNYNENENDDHTYEISEEDRLRAASLRANAQLAQDMNAVSPHDAPDFIRQIEGRLTISSQKHPLDSRSLELVNKTNQFNLNGRRFQEAEWQDLLNTPNALIVAASYRDKYGPLGKIAVIAGELLPDHPHGTNGNASRTNLLRIKTWVMSCRAFSRRIEFECLRWLFDNLNLHEVQFDFVPTPRNQPMQDFLRQVLEAPAEPKCRLSRSQFMARCPRLSHAVEELRNG